MVDWLIKNLLSSIFHQNFFVTVHLSEKILVGDLNSVFRLFIHRTYKNWVLINDCMSTQNEFELFKVCYWYIILVWINQDLLIFVEILIPCMSPISFFRASVTSWCCLTIRSPWLYIKYYKIIKRLFPKKLSICF